MWKYCAAVLVLIIWMLFLVHRVRKRLMRVEECLGLWFLKLWGRSMMRLFVWFYLFLVVIRYWLMMICVLLMKLLNWVFYKMSAFGLVMV